MCDRRYWFLKEHDRGADWGKETARLYAAGLSPTESAHPASLAVWKVAESGRVEIVLLSAAREQMGTA